MTLQGHHKSSKSLGRVRNILNFLKNNKINNCSLTTIPYHDRQNNQISSNYNLTKKKPSFKKNVSVLIIEEKPL